MEPSVEDLTHDRSAEYDAGGKLDPVKLIVLTISGDFLCDLHAPSWWTIADVKSEIKGHLGKEEIIEALVLETYGEAAVPIDGQSIAATGLTKTRIAEVYVVVSVVSALPKLHLCKPCSPLELSKRHNNFWLPRCREFGDETGTWFLNDFQYEGMDGVSASARTLATKIHDAYGIALDHDLAGIRCNRGEIIVISNPGPDPKKACMLALVPNKDDLEAMTKFIEDHVECFMVDLHNEEGAGEDSGFSAMTRVMAEGLTQTFELGFSDDVMFTPSFWGGYCEDGSIVAVLSSSCF